MTRKESPIACQMNALTIEERSRQAKLFAELTHVVQRVQELPDGIAVEFSSKADIWMSAAEFITLERRCCPFLSFSMEIKGEDGPMWLRITGREGVREFLAAELRFSTDSEGRRKPKA